MEVELKEKVEVQEELVEHNEIDEKAKQPSRRVVERELKLLIDLSYRGRTR